MNATRPQVDIVIPNFNGRAMLADCLVSLGRQTFANWQVTVVDNGSSDDSVAWLREHHPEVRLIDWPTNAGFAAAVNAGIRAGSHPLVFLLNNDTELAADCLELLAQAAETGAEYALFAPKMLSYYQRDRLDGAGEGYLRGGAGYRLGTMELDGGAYDCPRPVFGACGGAALYRRELFARIGWFDEEFFAYLEDVDLNLRANRAGCRCYYVPEARVFHIGSATTGSKFNDLTIRLSTRNSLYVLAKNYPLPLLLRFAPVIAIYQTCWLLFAMKKGRLWSYLVGIFTGLCGLVRMRRKYSIRNAGRISVAEFRDILERAEREAVTSIMRRRAALGRGNGLLQLYCRLFL